MPALRRRFCRVISPLIFSCLSISGACQTAQSGPAAPVLSLDDAVKIALADSPQLKSAGHEVEKANDAVVSARADQFPMLSVKAEAGALLGPLDVRIPAGSLGIVNGASFPTHDASVYSLHGGIGLLGATVAQPLTQLPRIRLNIRLQQLGAQAAREQQRGSRQTVAAGVKQTYYQILELQDGVAAAEQRLVYDQELQRTVADAVAHETALQADLMDAQAQTAQHQLTLTALQDQIADAKEGLNVLMGRDVTMPFAVVLPPDKPITPDGLAALRTRALSQRSDLRAAELRVEQGAIGRRLAHQANLPAVSLALSVYQLAWGVTGLPSSLGILGLQLDWSPLDWGRRRAGQDQNDQQEAQAQEALASARSQALRDVDAKVRQQAEAMLRLTVARAGQRAAQERLREMTNQYKDRAILLKDLRRQQAAAADADAVEQQAITQLLAARTALETAVGEDP